MRAAAWIALFTFLTVVPPNDARADRPAGSGRAQQGSIATPPTRAGEEEPPIRVRPLTVADGVSALAGHRVRVEQARVVGIFEPRVFLMETASRGSRWPVGFRDRVLVFIYPGALRVPATLLVGSTVTVFGVVRTLLGVRVTNEVPWPSLLNPKLVERLEIGAAVLATSVQTPDQVELTDTGPSQRQQ
jgi:hypothetical protein